MGTTESGGGTRVVEQGVIGGLVPQEYKKDFINTSKKTPAVYLPYTKGALSHAVITFLYTYVKPVFYTPNFIA